VVTDQDHVTATAAVAAVRAAERLELLPVDGGTAVTSATRGDMQLDAVHEGGHGMCLQLRTENLSSMITRRPSPLSDHYSVETRERRTRFPYGK
jgi:hypothetical protein